MPDLEARIREWKQSLLLALGGPEEVVEELESHLREEIDRLTQAGSTPEAALAAAQARLGRPADLAAEYAKVATPASWLPVWACLALPALLIGLVVPRFFLGGDALLAAHVIALVAGYAGAFYAGTLGVCYVASWLFRPIRVGQRRTLGRALFLANAGTSLLLLLGVVLGMAWASGHLGSAWSNDPREIGTSLAVAWFAAVAGLWWFVGRRRHLWVVGNVLGSTVAVWGWFGPLLLFPQLQNPRLRDASGIPPAILCLLVGATVVPLAVASLGFLPPGRRVKAGVILLLLLFYPAVGRAAEPNTPTVNVRPDRVLMDDVVHIRLAGLPPAKAVTLRAHTEMLGKDWQAYARFDADGRGAIDLDTQAPTPGTYTGVDPMGLFWSMEPSGGPLPKDHPTALPITEPRETRKGAELGLLLASCFPELKVVVATAPSHVAWSGLGGNDQESSWPYRNEPIPFVQVTWVFNSTRGSVLLACLVHASMSASSGMDSRPFPGSTGRRDNPSLSRTGARTPR